MLRKVRITLAALCFAAVTLLFLDFTGAVHGWLGWLARVQFLPAALAMNVAVVAALVLLTLLLGRVYCSVICPLGVWQDAASWLASRRKKRRFGYSREIKWLRYGVLAIFVAMLAADVSLLVAALEPYSAYGRIAAEFFAPVYRLGNNALAWIAERADSYAFYPVEVWVKGGAVLATAAATLAV
ncbi:MAG: 4Fe-4S binding protein, partial [Rikenellaceae bacterium]|nr:4Fe-4S binding protein [Rikenellaceae bacterium]